MTTADDLRAAGYTVDDTTSPDTWTVSGFNRTWVFSADDVDTARALYELALTGDNLVLRARATVALAQLEGALASWDTLTAPEFKAAMQVCARAVAGIIRMTIRQD